MISKYTGKLVLIGVIAGVVVFLLAGCGNTIKGVETDIYEKRKAISDFVSPSPKPVETEK